MRAIKCRGLRILVLLVPASPSHSAELIGNSINLRDIFIGRLLPRLKKKTFENEKVIEMYADILYM